MDNYAVTPSDAAAGEEKVIVNSTSTSNSSSFHRLRLDNVPPPPREAISLLLILKLFSAVIAILFFPLSRLVDLLFAYHYIYILTVHDGAEHHTMGVFASINAAKAAVAEVLILPQYRDRGIRLAFLEYDAEDIGARISENDGREERGTVLVLVQRMRVRGTG